VIAGHELELVMAAVPEPAIEQMAGQPSPPSLLCGHAEIDLAGHQADTGGQQREIDER
jgi:hypothetical protein